MIERHTAPHTRQRQRRPRRTASLLGALLRGLAVGMALLLVAPPVDAGPKGERVVKGKAKIKRKGNRTRIKASDGAVIKWESFDVGAGERVRIVQPGGDARVLNRVKGGAATRIDGRIKANGEVYIVNSSGVHFGGNAVVDVTRLVAAGGVLRNEDFLRDVDRFRDLRGDVINRGSLRGDGVALVGHRVENHGQILVPEGSVWLAVGDDVYLGSRDSQILIRMDPDVLSGAADADAPALENTGVIEARSARLAAGDSLALALREQSIVHARKIAVEADRVQVAGTLDASSGEADGVGGRIEVLGDEIALTGAALDASGPAGGGLIRVGGALQGGEGVRRALTTSVDADSRIAADATGRGDGGRVVVWADDHASVHGALSARGGAEGGDGGFVETSGLHGFEVTRAPRVSATDGESGTWLIDPVNIQIIEGPTGNGSLDDARSVDPIIPGGDVVVQSASSDNATVSNTVIIDALTNGSKVVVTTDKFLAEGSEEGNIDVLAPIVVPPDSVTFTTSSSLTLFATNDINVQEDIVNQDDALALDIRLVANDNSLMPFNSTLDTETFINANGFPDTRTRAQQPELGQEGDSLDGNVQAERGDLFVAGDATLETGGGDLIMQGVNITIEDGADILTEGGDAILFGANPVRRRKRLIPDSGDIVIDRQIETDGGSVAVGAGGALVFNNAGQTLDVGDGQLILEGEQIALNVPVRANDGDVDIGRLESFFNAPSLRETDDLVIAQPITMGATGVGQVTIIGADVTLAAPVTTGAGNLNVTDATTISIEAPLTAGDANVIVTARESIDVADGVAMRGNSIEIRSGRDLANAADTGAGADAGNLDLGSGTSYFGDRLVFNAGDGATETRDDLADENPDDPRINASIVAGSVATMRNADGLANPDEIRLIQDGTVDDESLPPAAAFLGGAPDGVDYTAAADDQRVDLPAGGFDPAKLSGGLVTLRGYEAPVIGESITPNSLELRVAQEFEVTPSLSDNLDVNDGGALILHAATAGVGDLTFSDPQGGTVDLVADDIQIRAGDGLGGDDDARVLVANTPDGGVRESTVRFQAKTAGAAAPTGFELRQDAPITDLDVPETDQFLAADGTNGDIGGMEYALRSDDGWLSLADPTKVADTELRLAGFGSQGRDDIPDPLDPPDPIELEGIFVVRSADVGGVASFTAEQELLDSIEIVDPGEPTELTLRAALSGGGVLNLEPGLVVNEDEISLEAIADNAGTGTGVISVPETTSPDAENRFDVSFRNAAGTAEPDQFVFRQDSAVDVSDVPGRDNFGGSLPDTYAVRSDGQNVRASNLNKVPDGGTLVLSSPVVTIRRQTGEVEEGKSGDLDFTATNGLVLIQSEDISLEASKTQIDNKSAVRVDASDGLSMSGFDADDEFAVLDDANMNGVTDEGDLPPTSPDRFSILQEADLGDDLLPDAARFQGGLRRLLDPDEDAVRYQLTSSRGGIILDGAALDGSDGDAKVDGADLEVEVRALNTGSRAAPIRDQNGDFVLDGDGKRVRSQRRIVLDGNFEVTGLIALSQKAMRIPDGTTIGSALLPAELISLQAAQNGRSEEDPDPASEDEKFCESGQPASLCFGSGVALVGEGIQLSAGDGSRRNDDVASPSIDASTNDPQFLFAPAPESEIDALTSLLFIQDAPVGQDDLPSVGSIQELPGPGRDGLVDAIQVASNEESVTVEDFARIPGEDVALVATSSDDGGPSKIILSNETGDLDLTADLGANPDASLLLAGDVVRLRSRAGTVTAFDPLGRVQFSGEEGPGSAPTRFKIVQDPSIDSSSEDSVPDAGQFGDSILGADYTLRSLSGDVEITSTIADRVELTSLDLEARGGDVAFALRQPLRDDDTHALQVVSLRAVAGDDPDGDGIHDGEIVFDTNLEQVARRSTIRSLGDQEYSSRVSLLQDTALIGDDVAFRAAVDGGASFPNALQVKAFGELGFDRSIGTAAPDGSVRSFEVTLKDRLLLEPRAVLRLGPDVDDEDVAAGPDLVEVRSVNDIRVKRLTTDGNAPSLASIAREDGDLLLHSTQGNVILRRNAKISVDGDFTARAEGDDVYVRVPDVAVAGTFAVRGDAADGSRPELQIKRRGDAELRRKDGALVDDEGVDVSANAFDWDVTELIPTGDGQDPVFGVPDPFDVPGILLNPKGRARFPIVALKEGFAPLNSSDLRFEGSALDVRPEGLTRADLARVLTEKELALPRPRVTDVAVSNTAELPEVGIDPRPPTAVEFARWLGGAGIYDDSGNRVGLARVAGPRLHADSAREALVLHRALFGPENENAPRIREILQRALDDYRRETRVRRVVGFEFRRYVRNRPSSQFEAFQTLTDLDLLFRRHRSSGLVPAEYRRIQAEWLEEIAPEGISIRELGQAIHPSRYVRGSDILDIFGD